MKLNAASEMLPLSRAEFMNIHPYAPEEQVEGYTELIENLCCYLAEITEAGCQYMTPCPWPSVKINGRVYTQNALLYPLLKSSFF